MTELEEFTEATIEALYFTDTGDTYQPSKVAILTDHSKAHLSADCASFWYRYNGYVKAAKRTPKQAGHDFWLTRQGHGTGFWDGNWMKPYDDILTKGSDNYGEFDPEFNNPDT